MAIKLLVLLVFVSVALGCSAGQVRYLTATRWTASPGGQKTYYLTYYEGTCGSGFLGFGKGCKDGDSKVRRCTLQSDNSVTCVDEAEASKALAKQ
jgi:hypothetical protein